MRKALRSKNLQQVDKKAISTKRNEILAVVVCHNEMRRLAWFLDYYRKLGIDRFFIVDNASDDESVKFLLEQPDVHIFHTTDSYLESRAGLDWSKAILDSYGHGHWCLTVDVDEILIYPGSETVPLKTLCAYLDSADAQGLYTFMIDMYPRGPLQDFTYVPGTSFLQACPCFDADNYHVVPVRRFPFLEIRGGPRERCFFPMQEKASGSQKDTVPGPPLKKIPLVKWERGLLYTNSTHFLNKAIPLANISGLILHFKFFEDFLDHAKRELARGQRWNAGAQYQRYLETISNDSKFTFCYQGTAEYRDSLQMIELGHLRPSWPYFDFVKKAGCDGETLAKLRDLLRKWPVCYDTQIGDCLSLWFGFRSHVDRKRGAAIDLDNATFGDVQILPSAVTSDLQGFCENLRAAEVRGWAFDQRQFGVPVIISLRVDGIEVARQLADLRRDDLVNVAGSTDKCGFCFQLPLQLFDGRAHELSLVFEQDGYPLKNSPLHVSPKMLNSLIDESLDRALKSLIGAKNRLVLRLNRGELQN